MSDILKIIEPSKEDMTFIVGETRELQYIVRSSSDFNVKDLEFSVDTLIKEGDQLRKTKFNGYAKITQSPTVIHPGKDTIVKVSVTVPLEYKEYVTKDDGNKAKQPFRVKLYARGIEHIEEW